MKKAGLCFLLALSLMFSIEVVAEDIAPTSRENVKEESKKPNKMNGGEVEVDVRDNWVAKIKNKDGIEIKVDKGLPVEKASPWSAAKNLIAGFLGDVSAQNIEPIRVFDWSELPQNERDIIVNSAFDAQRTEDDRVLYLVFGDMGGKREDALGKIIESDKVADRIFSVESGDIAVPVKLNHNAGIFLNQSGLTVMNVRFSEDSTPAENGVSRKTLVGVGVSARALNVSKSMAQSETMIVNAGKKNGPISAIK